MRNDRIVRMLRALGQCVMAFALIGCGVGVSPGEVPPKPGRVITADQIAGMGVTNAWQILERAHAHLGLVEGGHGPATGVTRRGRRSLTAASEPLVIVNGMRIAGTRILGDIRAHDIASIRVIGGIEATTRFGTGAGGGAILIELK